MKVHNMDDISSGTPYRFAVYRCDQAAKVGQPDSSEMSGITPGVWPLNRTDFGIDCGACCTPGYAYATAYGYMNGLVGAKAKIKTRYGALCGASAYNAATAHSLAWVGIINYELSPQKLWAQTGYAKIRDTFTFQGYNTFLLMKYFEVGAGSGQNQYLFYFDTCIGCFPLEGEEHTYQIELIPDGGLWLAKYDDNKWADSWLNMAIIPNWIDRLGEQVQWAGEIYGLETDMPGTYSNRCTIRDCFLRVVDSYYKSANFYDTLYDVGSTDSTRWGIAIEDATGIQIWDKIPQ